MATETNLVKNVISGASEYPAEVTVGANGDKLGFSFDNEIIIDDLIVTLGSSAVFSYKVQLIYPSGTKMEITPSAQSGDWVMNQDSDSRNLWYRLPRWTTLQIEVTSYTTGDSLKFSAIARG